MAITVIQWLGSAAVVYGSTLFGRRQAARYRERPRELRRLATLFRNLQTEISYSRVPLQEALLRVSHLTDAKSGLSAFFSEAARLLDVPGNTAQIAWENALVNYEKVSSLTQEDKEILVSVGRTVGLTGPDEQVGHLAAAIELLCARELEAIEDRKRYERVFKTVGILTGTLIVVLLI